MQDPGEKDREIILQRATFTTNAANEKVPTWTTLASPWASAKPISDGERSRAAEIFSAINMRFVIYWASEVANLDTMDRVSFDGRIYDIVGVKELGYHEELEITASARGER